MVDVARLAASDAGAAAATNTTGLNCTSSAASTSSCSYLPSAERQSIATFSPSRYPSDRSPSTNARKPTCGLVDVHFGESGLSLLKKAIRRSAVRSCASTACAAARRAKQMKRSITTRTVIKRAWFSNRERVIRRRASGPANELIFWPVCMA